jgi:cytoskeletal protein CcmA (bactofilin family)
MRRGINMNGNNLRVDSFDSSTNIYSTNRRWVPAKARANGNLGCNDTVTNSVSVGNFTVFGRVSTGPHGGLTLGPNGAVGSLAWHAAGNTGIQPGYFTEDMNAGFPNTVMPVSSAAWLPMPASVGGVITFSSSGSYRVSSGTVNGKLVVAAPNVRLRVDSGMSFSGTGGITINSNASITIYLNCPSAQIAGQGVINIGVASQCYIFGTPNLKSLDLGGNGEITCAVYAPQADVLLHGGGSSDQDFSGAIVANSLRFTGHYNIHFDESLLRTGPLE